ncbi:MAG: hypothetical protein WCS77_03145 [Elusimicrobiaceae bacterium]
MLKRMISRAADAVKREPLFYGAVVSLNAVLFAVLFLRGPLVEPDTESYVKMLFHRSPVYPVMLAVFAGMFGAGWLKAVLVFQLIATQFCTFAFAQWFRFRFALNKAVFWAVYILLLTPLLPGMPDTLMLANGILTDWLAWCIFMGVAASMTEAVARRTPGPVLWLCGLSVFAALARPQFQFLIPVSALFILAFGYRSGLWKQAGKLLLVLVVFAAGANIAERGYHKVLHGSFSMAPFMGLHLATSSLYMAAPGDMEAFKGREDYEFLSSLYAKLRANKLNVEFRGEKNMAVGAYYHTVCDDIFWETLLPEFDARFGGIADTNARLKRIDSYGKDIYFTLEEKAFRHPKLALSLFLGRNTLAQVYFPFVVMLAALWVFLRRRDSAAMLVFFAFSLDFFNKLAVSMVSRPVYRYSFYTEIFAALILLVLVTKTLEKKSLI